MHFTTTLFRRICIMSLRRLYGLAPGARPRSPGGKRRGLYRARFRDIRSLDIHALGTRAAAAVEFVLCTPLLIVLLGGAHDLGLAQYSRATLANAVAAGAEYAYLTGPPVTATNVQNVVIKTSFLTSTNLIVTVTGPTGYCVTGTGPTKSGAAYGSVCSDGSTAGLYVVITATYTNTGIMSGFMAASSYALTESATVMLK